MTDRNYINILIDGPSRSGKLLLAKLLLASPSLAFQHYSGDIERLLETIYLSKKDRYLCERLTELLRINLVHTIEDLKNARQISINMNDSSYYKKSSFYKLNRELIEKGKATEAINSFANGFVMHTHESELFLEHLRTNSEFELILTQLIHQQISIVRNPAAQSLSWISREYTITWNSYDKLTPFILYNSNHKLEALASIGINNFPWYVNESLSYYLRSNAITSKDIERLGKNELVVLAVCYLTEIYLRSFVNSWRSEAAPKNRHFVFHENLHDKSAADVERILLSTGLNFVPNTLNSLWERETNASRFGRSSIEESVIKVKGFISLPSIVNVLEYTSIHYCSILN